MLQTVRNRDYSCISTFKGELIANGNSLCKTEIASHRWVLSSGQSICSSGVVPCYLDNDNAVPIIVLCAICRTLKHVKTSYTSMPGMAMLRHQLSIRLLQGLSRLAHYCAPVAWPQDKSGMAGRAWSSTREIKSAWIKPPC